MENITINGEANYLGGIEYHLVWDCPFTGDDKWAQGEFIMNDEFIYHEVSNDDGQIIYAVQARI